MFRLTAARMAVNGRSTFRVPAVQSVSGPVSHLDATRGPVQLPRVHRPVEEEATYPLSSPPKYTVRTYVTP